MADIVTERIVEINVEESYKNLQALRVELDANKMALEKMQNEGKQWTSEYEKQLVAVKKSQSEYNRLVNVTVKSVGQEKDSYYALNAQLVAARKAWKELSAEERIADARLGKDGLTGKIQALDTELKALDEQVGQHQRNVGDYAGQVSKIAGLFGSAGSGARNAISGIMGFKGALDAASATPIVAILGALVTVLGKVGTAFKSSETAMQSLTVAFAPFKAAGQAVTVVLQNIAEWLGRMGERLVNLADRWGLLSDRQKENIAIAKEENALRVRQREILVENARLERDAAKARTEAVDRTNLSARERLALLETAKTAEQAILDNELEIARKQLEIAQRKADLTHNDIATNDRLAEAQANLLRVEQQHYDGLRRIESQMSAARKEILGEQATATTAAIEDDLAAINAADEAFQAEADKAYANARKARLASEEQARKDREAADKAEIKALADFATEQMKITDEAEQKQKARIALIRSNVQSFANSLSNLLGQVASAWANQVQAQVDAGKMSQEAGERQFEFIKAFQYAQTLINTSASVMTALAQPATVPWYVKAAQAAAAAVTGAAQAAQISRTTLKAATSAGGSLGTPITTTVQTSAPAVIQQVPVTRSVTGADVEDAINRRMDSLKVELVWSDVERFADQRRVQVTGSQFRPAAG